MRILIFGAGAVGGFIGGILTAAGADVTLVARGAQFEALANKGQRVGILSSTLQDVRFGRELELSALINAIIDVGRLTRVATPFLEVASACAGLLNRRIVDDGAAFAPTAVCKA